MKYNHVILLFQYNCLCRFEPIESSNHSLTRSISIQLLVSVRVHSKRLSLFSIFISIQLLVSVRVTTIKGFAGAINISIQLLVSVRDFGNIDNLLTFEYFNTTACVGSRGTRRIGIIIVIVFQYNCLCRFESELVRVSRDFKGFQYNCLCRFETTQELDYL